VCPLLMDSQTHNQTDGASFKVMTALSLAQVFGQVFETSGFKTLTKRVPPVGPVHCYRTSAFLAGVYKIHSFCSLSYDMCIASSKAGFLHNAIWCLLFKFVVSFFFSLIRKPLTSPSSCFCHTIHAYISHSVTSFRRQFLRNM